jgi:RNA polymerase sigma factor (sigma-70 family)
VHTAALDEVRSQQRRQARDIHALTPATMTEDSADIDVRRAIVRLPPRQRSIVYFFYWEDLDAVQIGELLGIATKTVRRQLAKAQFRLRKELQ